MKHIVIVSFVTEEMEVGITIVTHQVGMLPDTVRVKS
jgi:hypothetical protein